MNTILATKTTNLSEIKKGASSVIDELGDGAAAILNRSDVAAYLVSKELFTCLNDKKEAFNRLTEYCEELEEAIYDQKILPIINERLKPGRKKVRMTLDELRNSI